jgi:hypothetical protein
MRSSSVKQISVLIPDTSVVDRYLQERGDGRRDAKKKKDGRKNTKKERTEGKMPREV